MGHKDDSFLVGYNYTVCAQNIQDTVHTFLKLGFVTHPGKQKVLIATQEIQFIACFLPNSINMTIRIPPFKAERVRLSCQRFLL